MVDHAAQPRLRPAAASRAVAELRPPLKWAGGKRWLVPLLREVFEAYRSIYPQRELALELATDAARVMGVPELIVQALDKLMDNAASFSPAGGRITLRLAANAGHWELGISNEGPLLPAELQEHLFDPMVSLRRSDSGGVHLGLGLHIVRLIADFHRGRVKAENLPAGEGVRVTMSFPSIVPSA